MRAGRRLDRSIYSQGEIHDIVRYQLKPKITRLLRLTLTMHSELQGGIFAIKYVRLIWHLMQVIVLAHQIRNIVLYVLPEPIKESTTLANTHTLIDLREKFFFFENNPLREKELRALWNLVILIYDYDMYYRERADIVLLWLVQLVVQGLWRSSDGRREPRRPWWGKNIEICPKCGGDKGSQRVFADCPINMHS